MASEHPSIPETPAGPAAAHGKPSFWSDRVLWILIALAIVGFSIYLKLDKRVFPAASIDLKYSREQIAVQARGYAKRFGYEQARPIESTTFTFFNESKTFLEYELGLEEANRLMREKIPVWAWTTRFCQQYQLEQFRVWLSPQGKLIAFSRTIEDERPMPTISHADALALLGLDAGNVYIQGGAVGVALLKYGLGQGGGHLCGQGEISLPGVVVEREADAGDALHSALDGG